MALPPQPDSVPDNHLVIFVGHSDDATQYARAVKDLEHRLQHELDRMFQLSGAEHPRFVRVHIWEWRDDATAVTGGQENAITPFIQRADIAVFVFDRRVGAVTWEELNGIRFSKGRTSHVIATFSANLPTDLHSLEAAKEWANLLEKEKRLTEGWTDSQQCSLLPIEKFRDDRHLQEIAFKHLA